jgi:peptide/nickel transport system substrate-binding protein
MLPKTQPMIIAGLLIAVLLLMGIACGQAEEPTAVAPVPDATDAPAAQAPQTAAPAQVADPTPTFTPPPDATVRPTNTPAPTAVARTAPTPLPSGPPKYGGTIRMSAYADTKDWDPLGSASLSSVISYSQLYNQIVQFDTTNTQQVVGDLAESWEVGEDGTSYTFRIHENINWHDGKPLTVDDIVFTFQRYGNPCNGTGRSGLWRRYTVPMEVVDIVEKADCTPLNADDVVRAIDERTVEFSLPQASGAFLKFLAVDYVKVLPRHLLEDPEVDLNQGEHVIRSVSGSGPYILEDYQSGNRYTVNKNPNYFKEGRPYFDRIEHYIITQPATLVAQVEARQIDMANAGATNLEAPEYYELERVTNGDYVAHDILAGGNFGVMLNVKREPFSDHRVRKAIYLAVDRRKVNERAFGGAGVTYCPLMGMAHGLRECDDWPGIRAKESPGGQEDIAEARRLMAEAGFPEGFKVQYTVRQVGSYPSQCSVVKQDLEEYLGITGDIEAMPSAAGYAKYGTSRPADAQGDWEISCQGEGMVVLDADAIYGGVYLLGGTRNYTDWEHPKINEWFARQQVELDPDKRRAINKEAELWMAEFEDNHWVTMLLGQLFWIVHKDIKGFHAPVTVQYGFKHEDIWLDR